MQRIQHSRPMAALAALATVIVLVVVGNSTISTSAPQSPAVQTQPATSTTPDTPNVSYSGNGSENVGTIVVKVASTITWTNDGAVFELNTPDYTGITVDSNGAGGTSQVAPGTYRNVAVTASGNWTVQITPSH